MMEKLQPTASFAALITLLTLAQWDLMLKPRLDIKNQLLRCLKVPTSNSSDFDLKSECPTVNEKLLREAAVLVAVQMLKNRPHIIFTKRTLALKHHPGQVAFPGGKVDAEDPDAIGAALREAKEEIGLPSSRVEVLGCLAPHVTITGFRITPIIGLINGTVPFKPQKSEVEEIFMVPFSIISEPSNYFIHTRSYLGKSRKYYTVSYGPYYIWGATARMLRGMAERLQT